MNELGYKCEKWSSHHWSFRVREDGCICQDWHMDDKDGHFCILPIYPCGNVKDEDTEDEDTDVKLSIQVRKELIGRIITLYM